MARAPQAEGLVASYGNGFSTEIFARFQHSQEFWDVSDTPICRHSLAMQLLGDLPPWRLTFQQHNRHDLLTMDQWMLGTILKQQVHYLSHQLASLGHKPHGSTILFPVLATSASPHMP
jgi:hypothetical protein